MVPPEYVQTMRKSMLNRCLVSSYDEVCKLFKKELGVMQLVLVRGPGSFVP